MHPDDARRALTEIRGRLTDAGRAHADAMLDLAAWAARADEAGVPRAEIARLAGVSRTTVYAILDRGNSTAAHARLLPHPTSHNPPAAHTANHGRHVTAAPASRSDAHT